MKTSFYSFEELQHLGLKSFGNNVLVSRKASIYAAEEICLGNNVRIDDFCILSGNIKIGSYIHISAFSALFGSKGIEINDFSGVSPKSIIFSASDDFSGEYLIGPTIPQKFTNVTGGKVTLGKYVQIGAGSIVFPNISIGEGTVVGSMSLVNKSLPEWSIFSGIPAKFIKKRKRALLDIAKNLK